MLLDKPLNLRKRIDENLRFLLRLEMPRTGKYKNSHLRCFYDDARGLTVANPFIVANDEPLLAANLCESDLIGFILRKEIIVNANFNASLSEEAGKFLLSQISINKKDDGLKRL